VTERFGAHANKAQWKLHADRLTEPAEVTLRREIDRRGDEMSAALARSDYKNAVVVSAGLAPAVDEMIKTVFVMAEDQAVRDARLSLLLELRDRILQIGDLSELASDDKQI
jgi:glycyl-tRNA synthetase beta chain